MIQVIMKRVKIIREYIILVRHKVKEIIDIIQDDTRLRYERKRAKANRDKYVGMSSDVIEDNFYSKYGKLN